MPRALVVHSHFHNLGGAENQCFRTLEMLQHDFEEVVVLHAHRAPSLTEVATHFSIQLDPAKITFRQVVMPAIVRSFNRGWPQSLTLLQYAMVVRAAHRMAKDFDFIVSTFAECPVRQRHMVQVIHIPLLVSDPESLFYCGLEMTPARRRWHALYIALVRRVMGRQALIGRQVTITNSEWTAGQFLRHYAGQDVRPMYPGVEISLSPDSPEWLPFTARQNNMAIIGRITPAKRVEDAIAIVEGLRARDNDIGLTVVGSGSGSYADHLAALIAQKPWATWHQGLARPDMEALIARQKWGLHCYRFEHYGLAPAELQALGCITFVHDSGGQREIIRNPYQRYKTVEEAIAKIDAILRRPESHSGLLAEASEAANAHRGKRFIDQFRDLVSELTR